MSSLPQLVQDVLESMRSAQAERDKLGEDLAASRLEILNLNSQLAELEDQRQQLEVNLNQASGELAESRRELERQALVASDAVQMREQALTQARQAADLAAASKKALEHLLGMGTQEDLDLGLGEVIEALMPGSAYALFSALPPSYQVRLRLDKDSLGARPGIFTVARWAMRHPGIQEFTLGAESRLLGICAFPVRSEGDDLLLGSASDRLKEDEGAVGPYVAVVAFSDPDLVQRQVLATAMAIAGGVWRRQCALERMSRRQAILEAEAANMVGRKRELEQLRVRLSGS